MTRIAPRSVLAFGLLVSTTLLYAQVDVIQAPRDRKVLVPTTVEESVELVMEDDTDPFMPNNFVGTFTMVTRHTKNGEVLMDSASNLKYMSNARYTLVRSGYLKQNIYDLGTLVDLEAKVRYTLVGEESGKKTAFASPKKKLVVRQIAGKKPEYNTVYSDDSKVILGYSCIKVTATSPRGIWTGWVAKELPSPYLDMARSLRTVDSHVSERLADLEGFVLEYQWRSATGDETIERTIEKMLLGEVDESLLNVADFDVQQTKAAQ